MAIGTQSSRLIIQLGDGGSPTETFAATCGANTDSVQLINNLGEEILLDCTSPLDIPAVVVRHLESQDTQMSISGIVTTEAWDTWKAWADAGTAKNIRINFDEAGADGGGYWELPAMLSQLEMSRANLKTVTFSASISGSGARVWTDAA